MSHFYQGAHGSLLVSARCLSGIARVAAVPYRVVSGRALVLQLLADNVVGSLFVVFKPSRYTNSATGTANGGTSWSKCFCGRQCIVPQRCRCLFRHHHMIAEERAHHGRTACGRLEQLEWQYWRMMLMVDDGHSPACLALRVPSP